jgi:hypothetical protein
LFDFWLRPGRRRLVDGKIAEEWEIFDELAMMMAIGMELKSKEEK